MTKQYRPKYQVFISSTYEDLKDERHSAMLAVLKARHIPAGMEAFPASQNGSWELITRELADSDYYFVIVAGRYGSVDKTLDIGWTEKEYDYAKSIGLRPVAFIREKQSITLDLMGNADDQKRREKFLAKLMTGAQVASWSDAADLQGKVLHALHEAIADDSSYERLPRGWTRAPGVDPAVATELARLSAENAVLREQVSSMPEAIAPSLEPRYNLALKNRGMTTGSNGPICIDTWSLRLAVENTSAKEAVTVRADIVIRFPLKFQYHKGVRPRFDHAVDRVRNDEFDERTQVFRCTCELPHLHGETTDAILEWIFVNQYGLDEEVPQLGLGMRVSPMGGAPMRMDQDLTLEPTQDQIDRINGGSGGKRRAARR